MAVEWEKAPEDVIELAKELIEKHHPHLRSAKIGILFRSEAPMRKGRRTLGKAGKVTPRWKPLLEERLDFVIWLAADWWLDELDSRQQKALLDHELCHCILGDNGWTTRGHDIEEFNVILERYGPWREDLERTVRAIDTYQMRLGLELGDMIGGASDEQIGKVLALDPEKAAGLPG